MAQSLAALFASGATLALASLYLPHWTGVNRLGVAVTGLLGYPVAAILVVAGSRLPTWVFHGLVAGGTVIVSIGGYFAGGGAATATTAILYVWVSLSVAIVDLDDFKALNDREGHQSGDRLLKEITAAWSGALRGADLLARYGGDEFAVVLPTCPPSRAHQIIDRLRKVMPDGRSFS